MSNFLASTHLLPTKTTRTTTQTIDFYILKNITKILSIKNKKTYKLSCIFLCICILFFSTRKKFVLVNLLLFRSFSHNPSFFSDLKFHSYFQVNIGFLVNQKILKFIGLYYV
ncbi:hypothetical protein D9M71_10400 [compost metagenome]